MANTIVLEVPRSIPRSYENLQSMKLSIKINIAKKGGGNNKQNSKVKNQSSKVNVKS